MYKLLLLFTMYNVHVHVQTHTCTRDFSVLIDSMCVHVCLSIDPVEIALSEVSSLGLYQACEFLSCESFVCGVYEYTHMQVLCLLQLCQGKGFVCEFCSSPDIIYPFELDKVSTCSGKWELQHTCTFHIVQEVAAVKVNNLLQTVSVAFTRSALRTNLVPGVFEWGQWQQTSCIYMYVHAIQFMGDYPSACVWCVVLLILLYNVVLCYSTAF